MKLLLATVLVLTAAGCLRDDGPADPAPDGGEVIEDPFVGLFDSGDEFPREDCRPGAMAGFRRAGVWPALGLRTAVDGNTLHTFRAAFTTGEQEVAHTLTADDLIVRRTWFDGSDWVLDLLQLCDLTIDGTVAGSRVLCRFQEGCGPERFEAARPLHRKDGEAESSGLTLLGELSVGGKAVNVRVAAGVAYIAQGDRLTAVSVENPRAPLWLGEFQPTPANYYNDVKLLESGGRRYAVMAGSPSDVIDVTEPSSPQLVARIAVSAHTLDIDGNHAFFVGGSGEPVLHVYDLAIPTAPLQRAQFLVQGAFSFSGIHDLDVRGGIAYLSLPFHGLAVVDCRDPSLPVQIGLTVEDFNHYWHSPWVAQVNGRTIIINGDEGRDGILRLLDGDPGSPTYLETLGEWRPRADVSLHNLMAVGPRLYLAHYQDGVRVFDISAPESPRLFAYFNTWREEDAVASGYSGAFGIDVDPARRLVYVADSIRGLLILEEI